MSEDTWTGAKTGFSNEEKRQRKVRKEEKLAKKAVAASRFNLSPAQPVDDSVKKDKKRKRGANDDAGKKVVEGVATSTDARSAVANEVDRKERKLKKYKPAEPDGPSSLVPKPSESVPVLSKTQQKQVAKAALTPATTSTSTTIYPQPFTVTHQSYLSTHNITLTPPVFPPHLSLSSLPVHTHILAFLGQFKDPTPIQACSWPPLLARRDVVGIAETGSGKTLAFGAPGLDRLASKRGKGDKKVGKDTGRVSMLVLAPTRELAQQSHETLAALGRPLGVKSVCLFGGVGKEEQLSALRRKEMAVVVGTPGRTLDLANAGDLDLSNVQYLVLDEADRMLDQGFENDIRRIIGSCPAKEERQTVMFSATWPESVRRLASTFLHDPIRITVGSDELSANKRIEQVVEVLDPPQKDSRMLHHLKTHLRAHPSSAASPTRILVFALYKKEAQRLEQTIRRAGYNVGALHGDLGQDARFKALDKFKGGSVNVLVATDVAARGLDIPDVELVMNVTFPLTTEDFVHRCGRTGRAGKSGKAVTFFTGEGHERSLAGEFMRVLRDAGADVPKEMDRFPSTIKKKEHGSYGAFYKDVSNAPAPTKITFD